MLYSTDNSTVLGFDNYQKLPETPYAIFTYRHLGNQRKLWDYYCSRKNINGSQEHIQHINNSESNAKTNRH